eukprot:6191398-Pleurochrysis_carterae.AAC.1
MASTYPCQSGSGQQEADAPWWHANASKIAYCVDLRAGDGKGKLGAAIGERCTFSEALVVAFSQSLGSAATRKTRGARRRWRR